MFAMVLLSFFAFPCMQWNVHADDNDDRMLYNNYIYYTINSSNEVVIQDVRTSITEAEIPAEIDGYSVTEIGNYAFKDCTRLTSVTIPDSVVKIGAYAFKDCTALTDLTIPNSVTEIGWGIVEGTPWLAYQTDDFVVAGDGILLAYRGADSDVAVSNTVRCISGYAFSGCETVCFVSFSENLTVIDAFAFDQCTNLETITFSEHLTKIGEYAFHWCTSLKKVDLPDSVVTLGDHAFSYCKALTRVKLSAYMTTIENMTFSCCVSLTEVTIPESVTAIGNYAFQNCIALESITLSQGLTVINVGIFDGCTSLTQITILNPECIIADDSTTLSEQADIYGMVVSTANTYAIKYAHKFTALDWMRGDYDGDGILTVQDAYQILVVFASDSAGVPQTLTDTEIYAADYNDDGCINTQDAYAVMVAFAQSADGC